MRTKIKPKKQTTAPKHFNFSPQNTPLSLFPVGSEVEVTSDEEGFRGAWYLATVLQPESESESEHRNSSKVLVEYKNLLAEENGSALLKEFVNVDFVRPKPPFEDQNEVFFEVNDVVDAFYLDGWWTGVVAGVVGKGKNRRYKIFFSNPPDELEFSRSDLRVHRNWVDGKWVRPEKERMRELHFSPGAAVEVNIDPGNSPDAWWPATFIRQVSNNLYLVSYQSSQGSGLKEKEVDSVHIRPSPPSSSNKGYSLLEKVDAFHDFRWLSGVVTKILADGRYIVYFKRTKKEKELSHSDLRLHMEWSDGKWVHSSQDTSIRSISEKQPDFAVNGGHKEKYCAPARGADAKEEARVGRNYSLTLISSQKLRRTPGSEKADNGNTRLSNKRTKQTISQIDTIPLNSSSKRKNEKTESDALLSPDSCKLRFKPTDGLHNGTLAVLDSQTPNNPGEPSLKQSEDSNHSSAPTETMEDDEKHSALRRRGRPRKMQKPLKLRVLDEVDQTPNGSGVISPCGPIVLGLTHNGKIIESLSGSSGVHVNGESIKAVKDDENLCDPEDNHESVGSEQQKDGEATNLKRKRGRPPKVLFRVGSPKPKEAVPELVVVQSKDSVSDTKDTAETANEAEEPVAIAGSVGVSESTPFSMTTRRKRWRIINDHPRGFRVSANSTSKPVRKGPKSPKETVTPVASEPLKPVTLKRGRRHKSSNQFEHPTEDTGVKTAKVLSNGVARNAENVAETSSNLSDDDKPLSAWFEGTHSHAATDGKVAVAGTVGQCDGTVEKRDGNKIQHVGQPKDKAKEKHEESTPEEKVDQDNEASEEQDQTPSHSTAIVPVDNQDLPFVKNSLIWQMIESMEVLKQIPQKPHFRPLYNYKEECREGLAIGNMVTFTSLVDRISRLQFDDPKNLLDGHLESLSDLEELGFNVAPVRDRLNTLLSIKGRCEQAQNTANEIETQILEHDQEKSKIDEEIAEIDKKIAELNEKRALVMSKKDLKDAEMKLLQKSVDAIKGSVESSREEFEKVATSVW